MSINQPLVNPHEQAKAAVLATLEAARRNPNGGKELVDYLASLLEEMERTESHENVAAGGISDLRDEAGNAVVEITEGSEELTVSVPSGSLIASAPLTHLWELPPDAAEAKRKEMDAIWDALEREEESWLQQNGSVGTEAPGSDASDRAKGAEAASSSPELKDSSTTTPFPDATSTSAKKPKKSVTFEDESAPAAPDAAIRVPNWGDVVPATLKKRNQPTASSVMKFEVVERVPGSSSSNQPQSSAAEDSDDEEPDNNLADDGDEADESTFMHAGDESDSASDTDDQEDSEDESLIDSSDYYARRDAVLREAEKHGFVPSTALFGATQTEMAAQGPEFVPVDATVANELTGRTEGPSLFKSSRMAPASVPVTALGPNAKAIIREGKLVDDKLVVPADSESDVDSIGEAGRRTIELLRQRDADPDIVTATPIPSESHRNLRNPPQPSAPVIEPVVAEVRERVASSRADSKPSGSAGKFAPTRPSRFMSRQHDAIPKSTPTPSTGPTFQVEEGTSTSAPPSVSKKPTVPTSSPTPAPPTVMSFASAGAAMAEPSSQTIVESPSFPPQYDNRAAAQTRRFNANSVMLREVREREEPTAASSIVQRPSAPPKVSRFRADRM